MGNQCLNLDSRLFQKGHPSISGQIIAQVKTISKPVELSSPQKSVFTLEQVQAELVKVFKIQSLDLDPTRFKDFRGAVLRCNQTIFGLPNYDPVGWVQIGLKGREQVRKPVSLIDNRSSGRNTQGQDCREFGCIYMYHAIRDPTADCSNGKTVLKSILDHGLLIGANQACQDDEILMNESIKSILKQNKISQEDYIEAKTYEYQQPDGLKTTYTTSRGKVGRGICGSPYINTVCHEHGYTSPFELGRQQVIMAVMCRVNPRSLYISKKSGYWVVRQPKDVVPVAIMIADPKTLGADTLKHKIQKIGANFTNQSTAPTFDKYR